MNDHFDGTNESPDDQIKTGINKIIDEYAQCDADSFDLNQRRMELRKEAEGLGFTSAELQEAVRKLKKMSKRQRLAHEANVQLIIDTVDGRQAELWPADFERNKKRDEEYQASQTTPGPDADTNPRSDPDAGGAKPMTEAETADEQAEGESALEAMAPATKAAKKSQSALAAEKLAAAKLTGPAN